MPIFFQTTKKELELYLKKNTQVLKQIFDEISIGVLFLNYPKKSLLFANKYFRSLDNNKEESILKNIFHYISNNINQNQKLNISQDLIINENGKKFVFGFTAYQIQDNIIVVLLSEIAHKSIYSEIKHENHFFNKLSELVADIIHEIGNPIAGINMSLQVLLQNISVWPQEKMSDYIERTINEINRLSLFLKRIKNFSDEKKTEMKTIDLRLIIHKVFLEKEEILKQKNIKFKNMIKKDILISIDELIFSQIIMNLLNNSLQILESHKEIKVYIEDIDDFYIKLIFRNNGQPIPERLLEKIFSPLYTTKDHGSVIGLAGSLKMMARMGGTIKAVPPEDGQGAKFAIYIPNKIKK